MPATLPHPQVSEPPTALPAVPPWRRLSFRCWRDEFLHYTPANQRGAWLSCPGNDFRWLALVTDVWLGGVSLVVNETFPSGQLFDADLWKLPAHLRDDGLQLRLLNVLPLPAGRWQLNCAFVRPGGLAQHGTTRAARA